MQVTIHPEAESELEAAAEWYEEQQAGLGEAFLEEFERTLRRIIDAPDRWRVLKGESRKLSFGRFPYAIVYGFHSENIVIKAVMHLHRRPFYWRNR